MTNALSWDPVLRGAVYCAPACGCGCKKAAYDSAVAGAAALAARLGEGWTSRVWENMGWYYSAISSCRRWNVHPNIHAGKIEGYTAFLGPPGEYGGRWCASAKTPEAAIAATRDSALSELRVFADLLGPA